MRTPVLGAALALAAALSVNAALPSPAGAAKYATSESPFWRVGALSPRLSRACQRGEFGQVKRHLYNIGFVGPEGRALTGIARSDWNLYDPRGLAEERTTYHFYHQGYSDCRVYFAKDPPRRRGGN